MADMMTGRQDAAGDGGRRAGTDEGAAPRGHGVRLPARRLRGTPLPVLVLLTALLVALQPAVARPAAAEELGSPTFGFSVDLPEGWTLDAGNGKDRFSFADPNGLLWYNIAVYPAAGAAWKDARSFAGEISRRLSSEGAVETFTYDGRDAALAELRFSANGLPSRGFALFIRGIAKPEPQGTGAGSAGQRAPATNGPDAGTAGGGTAGRAPVTGGPGARATYDIALLAYTRESAFGASAALLVSALDGFSADAGCRLKPGPVSCYDEQAADPAKAENKSIPFPGGAIDLSVDPRSLDTSQAQVEREYKALTAYRDAPNWKEAWKRYYRMIYRDSYTRLDRLALLAEQELDRQNVPRERIPAALLAWVQDFAYVRSLNTADFVAPLDAAVLGKGDCDSRALLYVILLHHFDIDAIMMVSAAYSHAMAAVAIPGEGARFPYGGATWLVAETTAKVDLGMIGGNVADPSKWIGVDFPAFH